MKMHNFDTFELLTTLNVLLSICSVRTSSFLSCKEPRSRVHEKNPI